MKVLTIVGARPQFIKASALSRQIKATKKTHIDEVIIHTGQHFDLNMSDIFFDELGIPKPDYNLEISGLDHGAMTGQMIEGIERILKIELPDVVVVYGDTNSTLSGALAASKLHIPIAHIESGLRSHNMYMPEEINRIVTDRLSSLLFCPSLLAMDNLKSEGFPFDNVNSVRQSLVLSGDIMYDVVKNFESMFDNEAYLMDLGLSRKNYILITAHRQETTDDPGRLESLLDDIERLSGLYNIVMPVHPRTKKLISGKKLDEKLNKVTLLDPTGYMEMQGLIKNSNLVITDSGGLQKEAYFHHVPCITIRNETEWPETVDLGWNTLCPIGSGSLLEIIPTIKSPSSSEVNPYGDGASARVIVDKLCELFGR